MANSDTEDKDDKEEIEEVQPLDLSDDAFGDLSLEDLDAQIKAASENSEEDNENNEEKDDDDARKDGQKDGDTDGSEDGSESDDGESESGSEDGGDSSSGDGESGDGIDSGDGEDGTSTKSESGLDGGESDERDTDKPETRKSKKPEINDKSGESKDVSEKSGVNYKSEYDKLLAPFKANGKDMQVESVDDARTLMQMGANYNKKMQGLKPNLKLIKMLDNNNLLDEDKLSYLIDLDKKDPEAIKKFIKESGVDPLELDLKAEDSYKPNTYTVSEQEVDLDGTLEEIKETKSFSQTIDIISNKLDATSKKALLDNPGLIKIINEHVGTGVYERITQIVENERMLGRLPGLNDLEAYQQVGNAIKANGGFDQPNSTSVNDTTNTAQKNKKTVDTKLVDRKKAASSTKSAASNKGDNDFNPLSMSDEDIEKMSSSKFM